MKTGEIPRISMNFHENRMKSFENVRLRVDFQGALAELQALLRKAQRLRGLRAPEEGLEVRVVQPHGAAAVVHHLKRLRNHEKRLEKGECPIDF